MKNSEKYFQTVTDFITDVQEAANEFETTAQRLERYKGSSGYDQQLADAQATRDAAVRSSRERRWAEFLQITEGMREAARNRPLVPPTTEQAALLSVLQMRNHLSRGELERAAKQLDGCPLGLAVLDDLAEKHEAKGEPFCNEPDGDKITAKIMQLEAAANRLICQGVGAASRRIPENVTDCMSEYGSFGMIARPEAAHYGGPTSGTVKPNEAAISAFCGAVD